MYHTGLSFRAAIKTNEMTLVIWDKQHEKQATPSWLQGRRRRDVTAVTLAEGKKASPLWSGLAVA